jgi:serine phosphatase RsbU (regulator of sigma subunit)
VTEWVGVLTDVTEQREAERILAERAARQGHIAEALQRSLLLVPSPDAYPGLTVKPLYQSAEDDALVGGDFFDVFAISEGYIALVVGDGTGKGVEAATYTAEVKFALRAFLREHNNLATAVGLLNDFVADNDRLDAAHLGGAYVALVVALVNTRTGDVICAAAGAEPPLIIRACENDEPARYEVVDTSGPLLGIERGSVYTEQHIILRVGDMLALTTDGITEARRPRVRGQSARREFFSITGVGESLVDGMQDGLGLSESAQSTVERARRFAGGSLQDDVCLLLARRKSANEMV